MKMPFGKHAGVELADLPREYMQWLSTRQALSETLRNAVVSQLKARPLRRVGAASDDYAGLGVSLNDCEVLKAKNGTYKV